MKVININVLANDSFDSDSVTITAVSEAASGATVTIVDGASGSALPIDSFDDISVSDDNVIESITLTIDGNEVVLTPAELAGVTVTDLAVTADGNSRLFLDEQDTTGDTLPDTNRQVLLEDDKLDTSIINPTFIDFDFDTIVSSAVLLDFGDGDAITIEALDGAGNVIGSASYDDPDFTENFGNINPSISGLNTAINSLADLDTADFPAPNRNQSAGVVGLVINAADFGLTEFQSIRINTDDASNAIDVLYLAGIANSATQTVSYDPDSTDFFENLAVGESATDTFTYTVTDDEGLSST
ncbi:MAG: hypothetical protein AAF415_18200, partial [Pseudomonadota bacterium]